MDPAAAGPEPERSTITHVTTVHKRSTRKHMATPTIHGKIEFRIWRTIGSMIFWSTSCWVGRFSKLVTQRSAISRPSSCSAERAACSLSLIAPGCGFSCLYRTHPILRCPFNRPSASLQVATSWHSILRQLAPPFYAIRPGPLLPQGRGCRPLLTQSRGCRPLLPQGRGCRPLLTQSRGCRPRQRNGRSLQQRFAIS